MTGILRLGRTSACRRCSALIVWARTEAGKAMPVDPDEYDGADERANLAVMLAGSGALTCRVITADRPLMGYERRAMPHWATCSDVAAQADAHRAEADLPPNVLPFPTATARARARKAPR